LAKKLWESAQNQLKKAVESNNLEYYEEQGEAAFYGPKIDFMATDAISQTPSGHCAVGFRSAREVQSGICRRGWCTAPTCNGSLRIACGQSSVSCLFISNILLENFRFGLLQNRYDSSPLIKNKTPSDFADNLLKQAKAKGLRIKADNSNESVGKKIRASEVAKVPSQ
jgi:threonyl-tRNA synthetase